MREISSDSYHLNSGWIHTDDAWKVAVAFASLATIISCSHIVQHLSNYSMPEIQVYVVRILVICPIYAISSASAVILGTNGIYAEVFRDIYEAFVIYSFLNLILEYCGGESDCVYQMENDGLLRLPCPLCCFPPRPKDARLMRICHRGVLQFIIVKPLMALFDITLLASGMYFNVIWQSVSAAIYNVSYAAALYSLYLFYLATKQIIKEFRPVSKFLTVKSIIFATYYQSMIMLILLPITYEDAILWNDLLLCMEMVLFALLLWFAFPVKEFIGGIPDRRVLQNAKDVFKVKDIYQDVYHNFMPAYRDYALQRSQNEPPETIRLRTFFAGNLDQVALEMTERYRGRSKRMAFNSLLRSVKGATLRRSVEDSIEQSHETRWADDKVGSFRLMESEIQYDGENDYSRCRGVEDYSLDGMESGRLRPVDNEAFPNLSSQLPITVTINDKHGQSSYRSGILAPVLPSLRLSYGHAHTRDHQKDSKNATESDKPTTAMSHDLLRDAAISRLSIKVHRKKWRSSPSNRHQSSLHTPMNSNSASPSNRSGDSVPTHNIIHDYASISPMLSTKSIKPLPKPNHLKSKEIDLKLLASNGGDALSIDTHYPIDLYTSANVDDWSDFVMSSPGSDVDCGDRFSCTTDLHDSE